MQAIGRRSVKYALALGLGLFTAGALGAGCGGSSRVVDGALSEGARKAVFEKRVDVQSSSSSRQHSKSLGSKSGDRRP
jgi:hypothetical protein